MRQHSPEHVVGLEQLLRNISTIIKRRGRDILSNYPITPPQFNALLSLRHLGMPTMSQLCDHLGLASSTVTDLVDRMERNGLVERIRDCEDRRVIRLSVTDQGYEIVNAVVANRQTYLGSVLANLDDEKLSRLAEMITLLHDLMEQEETKLKQNNGNAS